MLAGATRVTIRTQSQAKEAGAAFLLRIRVECISVFLAFEVYQRLRMQPFDSATALPKPPPPWTICLPLHNYKRHRPSSKGDSSGKDGTVSSFHSGFG